MRITKISTPTDLIAYFQISHRCFVNFLVIRLRMVTDGGQRSPRPSVGAFHARNETAFVDFVNFQFFKVIVVTVWAQYPVFIATT